MFLHRKKFKAFLARKSVNTGDALEEKRCLYKTVPQSFIHNKVNIVTMQGGKKMFEKNVIFHGIANPFEKIPASAFNFVKKNKKNDDSQQKIVQNYEFETVKKIFT